MTMSEKRRRLTGSVQIRLRERKGVLDQFDPRFRVFFARSRFYFDKHQRVVVAAHNVDFAATASTEIAEENFVTATLQEPAR